LKKSFFTFRRLLWAIIITSAVFVASCEKEINFGLNQLPENDIVDLKMDTTIIPMCYTFLDDSVPTDRTATGFVGSYLDPIFGFTKASCAFQFSRSTILSTSEIPQADSAVLYLVFSKKVYNTNTLTEYYGNEYEAEQTLKVYSVTERLKLTYIDPNDTSETIKSTHYYASDNPSRFYNEDGMLAQIRFLPSQNDTMLSIRLPLNLAQSLVDTSNAKYYDSDSLFFEFFKGIYLKSDNQNPNESAILAYSLGATNTKMTVYFKNKNDTTRRYIDYKIRSNCATFNLFEHDYSTSPFYSQLNDTNTASTTAYIQAMGGLKTRIKLPSLNKWKDSTESAIVKAELVVKAEKDTRYALPVNLQLYGTDTLGRSLLLQEYNHDTYYNGQTYDTTSKRTYRFNVTKYVRSAINKDKVFDGLTLYTEKVGYSNHRAVIRSGLHPDGMKLYIMYTRKH